MGCKVVLIGGGSYGWTPVLAGDLFLKKNLDHSELVLVDIDPQAATTMKEYCNRMQEQIGSKWTVTVSDLDSALYEATIVCVSISTGGLQAMANDYHIPEKYGVFHTVGDSVGPGGISRTLRNVPVFLEIARKMERLCPNAWMVHVTNPLSQLTRAVCVETSIRCVGLCHNYAGTIAMLAGYFNAEPEEMQAVSVGVNHFTWMKNITVKGRPVEAELSVSKYIEYFQKANGLVYTNTTDDLIQKALVGKNMEYYFNFVLFERFGYFPVGSSNHVAENLPFYCNDPDVLRKYHIRRKGVLPRRQQLRDESVQKVKNILANKEPMPLIKASNESLSVIVEALYTGRAARSIVAMANQGQISNLPKDAVVETWATVNGSGIFPESSGDIPGFLTGCMQSVIDEQEAAVKAAISGEWQYVIQAMALSPQVFNKEIVFELTNELLEANRPYLPQFFRY